ncbi:9216_t:CDS:2 [Entrophospora sp. SA101]|nr:9216_t:CDS:2 [Entrophospora sp. SA101]
MTTKEEIKTQLNKAEARLEEAVNNLKEFMKENLEKFEKRWRIEELKEEKKRLEKEKVKWGDEVLEWTQHTVEMLESAFDPNYKKNLQGLLFFAKMKRQQVNNYHSSCKTATENPNKDSCANKGEGKPFENTTEDLENLMKIVTDIFGDKNILNKILEMQSKEQKNGAKKSANFAEIKRNINDKENVTIVTDHKVSDKMEISPEEKILIDMEKI